MQTEIFYSRQMVKCKFILIADLLITKPKQQNNQPQNIGDSFLLYYWQPARLLQQDNSYNMFRFVLKQTLLSSKDLGRWYSDWGSRKLWRIKYCWQEICLIIEKESGHTHFQYLELEVGQSLTVGLGQSSPTPNTAQAIGVLKLNNGKACFPEMVKYCYKMWRTG